MGSDAPDLSQLGPPWLMSQRPRLPEQQSRVGLADAAAPPGSPRRQWIPVALVSLEGLPGRGARPPAAETQRHLCAAGPPAAGVSWIRCHVVVSCRT